MYDANGSQLKRCAGGTVTRTASDCAGTTVTSYSWDPRSRLLNVSGGIVAANSYRYDPLNYRISKSDSRGSRADYLEGEHLEASYNGALPTARYMRGVVIDEVVNAYLYDAAGKWTNVSFHHDALTNTVGLSGHDGIVLQTTRYAAFGTVLSESLNGAFPTNRLKYTGREEDPDTGIYYYRARYYDPSLGRFISEDPLGFEAGVNFYAYVNNNPINASDPSGLATQITIGYKPVVGDAAFHQVVILTDTVTKQQFATRGGPASQGFFGSASNSGLSASGGSLSASNGNAGSGGVGFGQIVAQTGSFNSTFRDTPSAIVKRQEVGTISTDFADSVTSAINFAAVTNKNAIPYWPLGPNSNSYASTFVESLTGSRPTPIVTAPGYDLGKPSPSLSYSPSPLISAGGATGSWGSGASGSWSNRAAGGFLLYPNKLNTNTQIEVYSK